MDYDNMDVDELLAQHRSKREKLIEDDKKLHFSYNLESSLTPEERQADEKLS